MKTHIPGFPRIGAGRELKKALEDFWKGKISERKLYETAAAIRKTNWQIQKESGLTYAAVNDFSLYDHVLDTSIMLGIVPDRFRETTSDPTEIYFSMARGSKKVRPLGMRKWFDTNYHYMVPELNADVKVKLNPAKVILEAKEAVQAGYNPKPVILGPITYLSLCSADGVSPWGFAEKLAEAYAELTAELSSYCEWIQIDEPILSTDLSKHQWLAFIPVHRAIKEAARAKLMLASYYGEAQKNADLVFQSGYDAFHTELGSDANIKYIVNNLPEYMSLSAGIVSGRNIWKTDGKAAFRKLNGIAEIIGKDRLMVSSTCPLLHVPVDLGNETELAPEVKGRLAFAVQKCGEIALIAEALENGTDAALTDKEHAQPARRMEQYDKTLFHRQNSHKVRKEIQQKALALPLLPTTTIGSFPQTQEIRQTRLKLKKGEISRDEYESFIKTEIAEVIKIQEQLGLDVPVHGEPERNDMVEYFAEYLDGFAITKNGWVQSYGSRCVKPPVIYGDVTRPAPITVKWYKHAKSLTEKHVKGMLTGPVTILQWSFVRDDMPKMDVCAQIAFAMRGEVLDLERAGCKIIQIDEAAFREGLPLRKKDQNKYLKLAADCFRLTASGVADTTQIHTHMCYSEFNSIMEYISAMDADVISIEASRGGMKLLEAFKTYKYRADIGPGVYDIHSPRVPSEDEIIELVGLALESLKSGQLWINPDCGLKTRNWEEVIPSLTNMVNAALKVREKLAGTPEHSIK